MNAYSLSRTLVFLLIFPTLSLGSDWDGDKLHSEIQAIEKARKDKNWIAVIETGQKALKGCIVLSGGRDPQCIAIMTKISVAYLKSQQLDQHPEHVKKTYELSSSVLGAKHFHTIQNRDVYHLLLINSERYREAIPLVLEFIDVEKAVGNDEFKILNWLIELYGLYKVSEQTNAEENTLIQLMNLTEKLLGREGEDFKRVATLLAQTYCENKKYHEFFSFAREQTLNLRCPSH